MDFYTIYNAYTRHICTFTHKKAALYRFLTKIPCHTPSLKNNNKKTNCFCPFKVPSPPFCDPHTLGVVLCHTHTFIIGKMMVPLGWGPLRNEPHIHLISRTVGIFFWVYPGISLFKRLQPGVFKQLHPRNLT